MLKYLRLRRLLSHWDETLEQARKGRYSSERFLRYLVEEEWGSFLNNPQLTAALIDRLTSHSHVINMKNCTSLRAPLDK
jgi:DNA replication protein DnaC